MDKAFVSPFLFDIKRSEVDGPILQFQSTIFERDDLKKLVTTLNKACDKDGLSAERLNKAFDVWYPTLEEELNKLKGAELREQEPDASHEIQSPRAQEILEEILELSRINQKLIRNPDGSLGSNLEEIANMVRMLIDRTERPDDPMLSRRLRRFHPMMLDEIMHMSFAEGHGLVGVQMALGLVRSQMPWIYDVGMETVNILRSRRSNEEKHEAIRQFRRVMEFSFEHPMMREAYMGSKEMHFIYRRLPDMLIEAFERNVKG
jgi:hypothetical protein